LRIKEQETRLTFQEHDDDDDVDDDDVNFEAAIREMYPQIFWELFADSLGSAEHNLLIAAVRYNFGRFLFALLG